MNIKITQETLSNAFEIEWKVAHDMVTERGYYKSWDDIKSMLDGAWQILLAGLDSSDERNELLSDLRLLSKIAFAHRYAYLDQEKEAA